MKKFLVVFCTLLMLTGCSQTAHEDLYSSGLSQSEVSTSSQTVSQDSHDAADASSAEENSNTGGMNICGTHKMMYHFIDGPLIDYVGMDVFNAWIDSLEYDFNEWNSDENCNIIAFVEHFQISKETFISLTRDGVDEEFIEEHDGITMYSMERIDAIYSGDPKEVNRVFCGGLAVYNENDGQLYSLHWIANHTAEECVAIGLPLDQVQQIVEDAQTKDYWRWNELGKEAETTLEQMEAIEASADAKE